MAEKLTPGKFKIVSSLGKKPPTGVTYARIATQVVRLDEPVQEWEFDEVGTATYRLRINGYSHVGVEENKVIASIIPEHEKQWFITYIDAQHAYTIALGEDRSKVWTVSPEFSTNPEIWVTPFKEELPLEQLFEFIRVSA